MFIKCTSFFPQRCGWISSGWYPCLLTPPQAPQYLAVPPLEAGMTSGCRGGTSFGCMSWGCCASFQDVGLGGEVLNRGLSTGQVFAKEAVGWFGREFWKLKLRVKDERLKGGELGSGVNIPIKVHSETWRRHQDRTSQLSQLNSLEIIKRTKAKPFKQASASI